MNFNDLPCDIKKIIFNKNREEQIKIEKEKFNIVIDNINDVGDCIRDDFFEDELRAKDLVFIFKFHQETMEVAEWCKTVEIVGGWVPEWIYDFDV